MSRPPACRSVTSVTWASLRKRPVHLRIVARYPLGAMHEILVQRPQDAWAATVTRQNG